ncbi:MAG TPA: SDR family NAD(P)-dependent oxidoreductase [Crenotrichaceae bacterium]|nr:SDR family NAD(P)-dependent oxidoreductase [Crenotrichaceae bacterium]
MSDRIHSDQSQFDLNLWKQPIAETALENKVILISGAAGDLGSQLAKDCAALGATLVLMDKNTTKLEHVFDHILAAGHPEPVICPVDFLVAQPVIYVDLLAQLSEQFGALHGLIHCAALFDMPSPVIDIDAIAWQQQIHVNLTAAYLLTTHLLPLLQQTVNSRIIFTSDSVARRGSAYWGAYGVAKAGLEQFAHILAEELEKAGKVSVNTVIPGPINTHLRHCAYPAENRQKRININRITPFYLRLLDKTGDQVHGQIIDAQALLEA